MSKNGFSLFEVLVVLGTLSILMTIALPRFSDYLRRVKSDSQTRFLYTELLQARARAVYQRRPIRVRICRDRFSCYSSAVDEEQGARPMATWPLRFPITSNAAGDGVKGYRIDFDERGLATNRCAVCLESCEDSGATDSVVIAGTRVSLGKKDKGDECKDPNISKK